MTVKDIGIQRNPSTSKYRNEYVIKSEFMHGDAEFTEYRETAFPADRKELVVEFLNWLNATSAASENGDYHEEVEGFHKFNSWSEEGQFEYGLEGWPLDENTSCEARYMGSELTFYDAYGVSFNAYTIE